MKPLLRLAAALFALLFLASCSGYTMPADVSPALSVSPSSSDFAVEDDGDFVAADLTGTRGVWKQTTYRNDFANLTFVLPAGWEIVPEEELFTGPPFNFGDGMVSSLLKWNQDFHPVETQVDMMTASPSTSFVMLEFIRFENIPATFTAEALVEDLQNTFLNTEDFSSPEEVNIVTAEITGKTYPALLIQDSTANSVNDMGVLIAIRVVGNVAICVIAASGVGAYGEPLEEVTRSFAIHVSTDEKAEAKVGAKL